MGFQQRFWLFRHFGKISVVSDGNNLLHIFNLVRPHPGERSPFLFRYSRIPLGRSTACANRATRNCARCLLNAKTGRIRRARTTYKPRPKTTVMYANPLLHRFISSTRDYITRIRRDSTYITDILRRKSRNLKPIF